MLDVRFSHLYFCQSLHTLQRGLAAIADLLVFIIIIIYVFKYRSGKFRLCCLS